MRKAELKPTKKYAIGTKHELLSGEIEIIDRYLGDDGYAMLKYKFLESGDIEENKEANIASNIAKSKKKKAYEKLQSENQIPAYSINDLKEDIRGVQEELKGLKEILTLITIQQATILQRFEKHENR